MKLWLESCFFLTLLIPCIFGCSKNHQQEPQGAGVDTTSTSVTNTSPSALYIDCGLKLRKINAIDSSLIWQNSNGNITFGTLASPMVVDSANIYKGGTKDIAAFSKKNGNSLWSFHWPMYEPAPLQYREPVVNDSLAFFASTTDKYSVAAKLQCANKNTGILRWENIVDNSSLHSYFNTTPVLLNDNVLLVIRDVNYHLHLTAYRISDGSIRWSSEVNDDLSTRPKAIKGRVYSFSTKNVTCYNGTDGSILWQTNLPDYPLVGVTTFIELGQAILVEIYYNSYDVYGINAADGRLIKKATIQEPNGTGYSACIYASNKLIITQRYGADSASVRCFDLSSRALTWERHFKHALSRYDENMFTPVMGNNYIIFPTIDTITGAGYQSFMHFLNLEGKEIKRIPFESDVSPLKFAYEEKAVIYNQIN